MIWGDQIFYPGTTIHGLVWLVIIHRPKAEHEHVESVLYSATGMLLIPILFITSTKSMCPIQVYVWWWSVPCFGAFWCSYIVLQSSWKKFIKFWANYLKGNARVLRLNQTDWSIQLNVHQNWNLVEAKIERTATLWSVWRQFTWDKLFMQLGTNYCILS